MVHEDYYDRKPKIGLGKIVIGGVIGYLALHFIDPHFFDVASSTVGNSVGNLVHSVGIGGATCADLDKQYGFVSPRQAGGYRFDGLQTASCAAIQSELQNAHSPMASSVPQIFKAYADEGINNGAAFGVAKMEGQYATVAGVQSSYENIGAMRYASPSNYPNPHFTNSSGWMDFHAADYPGSVGGWAAGAQDHAALVRYWINNTHNGSVWNIISILSPSSENNVPLYVNTVDGTENHLYQMSVDFHNAHPSYPNASVGTDVASLAPTSTIRRA